MKLAAVARATRFLLVVPIVAACATAGNVWLEQPLETGDSPIGSASGSPPMLYDSSPPPTQVHVRTLGAESPAVPEPSGSSSGSSSGNGSSNAAPGGGRSLGVFRNTYYDFPSESDYEGAPVALMSQSCKSLGQVPRGFFEALCVQGSGTLRRGVTVSFGKRDCECAPVCPKTGQKICFDELEARDYPWGRGATGKAITPLLTVAVDPQVIPLGTAIYVPELDGLPRDPNGSAAHDGCFVAQDKGLSVTGNHVDFFTGHKDLTALWNRRVPSNRGVTVVVDSPRCARVTAP